ncbi:MAG: restriction endonuclease subunit S [Polaromonas sp.]|nr:restriction endonuclease subunit S [Polaromonas sp.]
MTVAKVKLGEAADILSGYAFKSELFSDSEGMPLIRIRDVVRGFTETRYSGEFGDEFVVQNGEIVIGMDGNFNAAKWSGGPALLNQRVCKIKARESVLNENYLFHYLPNALKKIEDATPFVTVKHLSVKGIREIEIPIPPLSEQIRIAAILDKADVLRIKRREALAQLDNLAHSIFIEMFGDPATNPKGWPYKSLIGLGKVVTGGTPPSSKSGMFDGPIPFVTPGDLESDEPVKRSLTSEGAKESRTVRAGATLVCCIGATIGKMGIAQVQSAFNQQLNAVEWSGEINDLYGYAVLRFFKPTIKIWGASTTLPILKKSSFEKIEIPVPPLTLQRAFAQRVNAAEKLRMMHRSSLIELDELFASLQKRAFKGEL